MSQAEYARRRGVAKSAVHKAVTENRISLIDGKIDPAVADIQWERNTRARADSGRPGAEQLPLADQAPAASSSASAPDAPAAKDDGEYGANRARRERYEADLAELKLREQQGDLVRIVEVRAEISKRIGQLRMSLLQVSARLAHVLTPEARVALDLELRGVLSNIGEAD